MNQNNSSTTEFIQAFKGWGLSIKGLFNNKKGEWWLIFQAIFIMGHLVKGWPKKENLSYSYPLSLEIIGIIIFTLGSMLCIYTFISLGPNLSPLPEPKSTAQLVTSGAYQYCRHPLYLGILLCSVAVTIYYGSLIHLFLTSALAIILKGKAKREENNLNAAYTGYKAYCKVTPGFIPKLKIRR